LEQYATPADLAAPLLFEARSLGDIEGKRVVDLGCGTGIFAIGAAILGAADVVGVDVDADVLAVARREASRLGVKVGWVEADVRTWRGVADTVIMNPPFGAQQRHADRPFLDAAMQTATVVYTMHHAPTRAFIETYAEARGFTRTHAWVLAFPLRHQFRHQEKAMQVIDVVAIRLIKKAKNDTRVI
jgi:putative methylase